MQRKLGIKNECLSVMQRRAIVCILMYCLKNKLQTANIFYNPYSRAVRVTQKFITHNHQVLVNVYSSPPLTTIPRMFSRLLKYVVSHLLPHCLCTTSSFNAIHFVINVSLPLKTKLCETESAKSRRAYASLASS